MKLKLGQVINSWEVLQRIVTKEMPIRQSYLLQENLKSLEPHARKYEERRYKLISEKYGEKVLDENKKETDKIEVTAKNREKFYGELLELQSTEIELNIYKIKFSDDFKMTPQEVSILLYMIDIDDEKEENKNG